MTDKPNNIETPGSNNLPSRGDFIISLKEIEDIIYYQKYEYEDANNRIETKNDFLFLLLRNFGDKK